MDSNKSIDGLKTKRAKTTALSPSQSSKSTASTQVKRAKTVVRAKSTKTSTKRPAKATSKSTPAKPKTKPSKPIKPIATNAKNPVLPPTAPTSAAMTDEITLTPHTHKDQESTSLPISTSAAEDFLKPTQIFDFDEQDGKLKTANASSHTTTDTLNNSKPKKVRKPVSKKHKIIKRTIIVIVLLLIIGIAWLILWGNGIIAKITGGQGNVFDLLTFTEPTYNPLKADKNGRTNILAFGTSGYNMEGDEGNGVHDGAQLTDSIMIISFDQESKDVVMLSLPRDLKASPTCTATGKINEVYWCNDGGKDNNLDTESKAANALMEEVSDILGIDFQYYAHLNWGSLVQIVDTLGGIKVTLDEDILDYGWTNAVFKAGTEYTIDGEQALGLARARHGTANGDFSRGASQQKILIGIKDRIAEKGLSIPELMDLATTLGDNLRTNFSLDEFKTLAHLASDIDLNNVRQISLLEPEPLMTTGNINGISYVLPVGGVGSYSRIKSYIETMLSSDPRVRENASILVLNGTETSGLASTEEASLEKDGYKNIYTDNAPTGNYLNQYSLYALDDSKPGTKKLLEEKYSITAQPFEELPVGVPTTYDFILILGKNDTDK